MTIKSKIITCLVFAAGMAASQAQVGYATVSIRSGFNLLGNPLSGGLTNGANEIGLTIDGATILTWTGIGFSSYTYEFALGWLDRDRQPVAPPSLPPGEGFFFFNPGPQTNITFVGGVVPSIGQTNRLVLPSGYSLVSSPLPASVSNITTAPVSVPLIDGMLILTWSGNSYVFSLYDTAFGGWVDTNLSPIPPPTYSIGQGFFFFNPGPAATWIQSLP